jgi:uncharacterized membrane protein (UPF0127 family)
MVTINKKSFILSFFAIILVLGTAIFLFGYSQDFNGENFNNAKKIKYVVVYGGKKVKVDLAADDITRQQGLSGRLELKDSEGLLFIFEKPGKYQFWMKDMNFPIDIIWIDDNFNMVVYIKKDARPELYPETYGPGPDDMEARYVLEVPAGFSEKYNLKKGDRVGFEY